MASTQQLRQTGARWRARCAASVGGVLPWPPPLTPEPPRASARCRQLQHAPCFAAHSRRLLPVKAAAADGAPPASTGLTATAPQTVGPRRRGGSADGVDGTSIGRAGAKSSDGGRGGGGAAGGGSAGAASHQARSATSRRQWAGAQRQSSGDSEQDAGRPLSGDAPGQRNHHHQQQRHEQPDQHEQQQQQQQQLSASAILAPPQKRRSRARRPGADPGAPGNTAALAGAAPRFAPVLKGDLALPGGPQWSALRRHVCAAGSDPELPTIRAIVVVEGDEDRRALARAVNAPVYVCDGTRALRSHAVAELQALASLGRPVVVLTDPDERGRQLRGHIDAVLGPALAAASPPRPLLHAFVPEASAMSGADGPVHEAGNRGIEHAVPGVLVAALRAAAPSRGPAGGGGAAGPWDLARLHRLRLSQPFDANRRPRAAACGGGAPGPEGGQGGAPLKGAAACDPAGGGGGGGGAPPARGFMEPSDRRRRLCALLGLGRCTGAQLVAALNRYFDEARVAEALAAVDAAEAEAAAAAARAEAAAGAGPQGAAAGGAAGAR